MGLNIIEAENIPLKKNVLGKIRFNIKNNHEETKEWIKK